VRLLDRADFKVLYQSEREAEKELFQQFDITESEYVALASKNPSIGFEIDGKCVGGMFIHQDKLHLSVLPEYHSRWAFLYTPAFKWAFSIADPLRAIVNINNTKVIRLINRHDYQLIDKQGSTLIYLLTDKTTRYPK